MTKSRHRIVEADPVSLTKQYSLSTGEKSVLAKMAAEISEVGQLYYPTGFLNVKANGGIMDSITVYFATTPRTEWENGIFHNADGIILHVSEKDRRYETGFGPYTVEANGSNTVAGVKFIRRTGSRDQAIKHIENFFRKVAAAVSVNKNESVLGKVLAVLRETT